MVVEIVDEGAVRWIWMNRPDKLNALSRDLLLALPGALAEADANPSVKCVVLAGRGRAFSAGGDLSLVTERRSALQDASERNDLGPVIDAQVGEAVQFASTVRMLFDFGKPTVAALHGTVAGGALCMALACDFRIAANDATLRPSFMGVGLPGDFGLSYLLPSMIGRARAIEIIVTKDVLSATESADYGLVTKVAGDGDLVASVGELASRLVNLSPFAYRKFKENLGLHMSRELAETVQHEAGNSRLGALSSFNAAIVDRFLK